MNTRALFTDKPDNASMPASTVIPVLQYNDVAAAVAWLCSAFGFSERLRIGTHRVQLNVGSGAVVAASAQGNVAPTGQSIMVRVMDVDAHFKRAAEFGAKVSGVPETYPFGERQYSVRDMGGHIWTFSQSIDNVNPASWGGELVAST